MNINRIEKGRTEGELRVNKLIQLLIARERSGEIARAVSEQEFQEKLFQEFGL